MPEATRVPYSSTAFADTTRFKDQILQAAQATGLRPEAIYGALVEEIHDYANEPGKSIFGRAHEWLLYAMFGVCFLGGCEAAQPQSRKVEMLCGNFTWTITCGRDNRPVEEDSRECNQNKLSIRDPDGKTSFIPDPPMTTEFHDDKRSVMIEGTTPTAMSCLNKAKVSYVSVEYSRGPGSVGLFLDDFTSNGQRLTSVGGPVKRPYISPFKGVKWSQLHNVQIEEEK